MNFKGPFGATSSHMTVVGIAAQFANDGANLVGIESAAQNVECLGAVTDAELANFTHITEDRSVFLCVSENHVCCVSATLLV